MMKKREKNKKSVIKQKLKFQDNKHNPETNQLEKEMNHQEKNLM